MNIAFNYLIVHQFVNFKRVYIFYNRKISSNTSNAGKNFLVDFFFEDRNQLADSRPWYSI